MQLSEYRRCVRLPRTWGQSDAHFHARLGREVKKTRLESGLVDLDAYVLGRMYDYMGHVIRAAKYHTSFLPYIALCHRDKQWCLQHAEILGFQGHAGRVSPWTHERQYSDYFTTQGLDWKQVAADRSEWSAHKYDWLKTKYGARCPVSKLF